MKSIVAVELGEVIFVHIRFFIILRIGVHICRARVDICSLISSCGLRLQGRILFLRLQSRMAKAGKKTLNVEQKCDLVHPSPYGKNRTSVLPVGMELHRKRKMRNRKRCLKKNRDTFSHYENNFSIILRVLSFLHFDPGGLLRMHHRGA